MAAWRYEISLLVLKNTRREISYLCAAMYYPLYIIYSNSNPPTYLVK